jgi:hypothetical protein
MLDIAYVFDKEIVIKPHLLSQLSYRLFGGAVPQHQCYGSPGDNSIMEKTINDIPSITGIIINILFAMYLSILISLFSI